MYQLSTETSTHMPSESPAPWSSGHMHARKTHSSEMGPTTWLRKRRRSAPWTNARSCSLSGPRARGPIMHGL